MTGASPSRVRKRNVMPKACPYSGLRRRAQQHELSCPRSVSVSAASTSLPETERAKHEARCKREQPGQSHRWKLARRLRQFTRLCGCRWRGSRRHRRRGRGRSRCWRLGRFRGGEAAAAGRGTTTGTSFAVATSSSRRLSGFLSVSLSSLPVICIVADHRVGHLGFLRVIERQGIGPGVDRARGLWHAGNGPFFRAPQHVLVLLSAAHRIALNQTSHRGHLPALVLRQQVPIPSLRVCGFDCHHTERDDNDR
jgi:hypothetical protein